LFVLVVGEVVTHCVVLSCWGEDNARDLFVWSLGGFVMCGGGVEGGARGFYSSGLGFVDDAVRFRNLNGSGVR
jgi:hypothetical protein